MTLPATQHTLEKMEHLVEAMGYKVRYEKGNFRTGTCILEHNRIIVINKFSGLESKIDALVELIPRLTMDKQILSDKQKQFFDLLTVIKSDL